jgi:ribosomal protein L35
MKTNKSLTKRFKVTKKGKVLARKKGQDHFRAKKTGDYRREKRNKERLAESVARNIKKAIN